jgi:hypothetical protein
VPEEKEVMMQDPKKETPVTNNQTTIAKGAVLRKLRVGEAIYQFEDGQFNLVIKGVIKDENAPYPTLLSSLSVMADYPIAININESHGAGIAERIY